MSKRSQRVQNMQSEFSDVLKQIQESRQKVFTHINTALIDLYWQIGQIISQKVSSEAWGKSVVSELAKYITQNAPEIKGFSDKNLWRMKQFYETYHADAKLSSLARELPWTHNTIIFSRCKSAEEREYYLRLCIKEHYSSRDLERQISSSHFERTMLGNQKLSAVLREIHPSIDHTLKDNYVLEFLGLPREHEEKELQTALIRNMKQFILELGRDFIFIGEEYRLQVGNEQTPHTVWLIRGRRFPDNP
jgi:predicted nuclease of restriction endonuclease-like (RecB) superfamily